MDIDAASKLCNDHGTTLLHYKAPDVATLLLASGEQVVISVGTTSAKTFRRRALLGWLVPRCCAAKSLVEWEPRYTRFSTFDRRICRAMVLDGLLDLVSRIESIAELCVAWCVIRNPVQVAALAMFTQTFHKPKHRVKQRRSNHTSEVVRQAFWIKLLGVDLGSLGQLEFEFASQG